MECEMLNSEAISGGGASPTLRLTYAYATDVRKSPQEMLKFKYGKRLREDRYCGSRG